MRIKRLTIDLIREKYWDYSKNKGKPIKIYTGQDLDGHVPDGTPPQTAIFDGTLIHCGVCKHHKPAKWTIPNWIPSREPGPYLPEDEGQSLPDFYYLPATTNVLGVNMEYYEFQVCSGPLNAISTDCLDEVGVWIKA